MNPKNNARGLRWNEVETVQYLIELALEAKARRRLWVDRRLPFYVLVWNTRYNALIAAAKAVAGSPRP